MAKAKESETKMAERKVTANTTRLVGGVTGSFVKAQCKKAKRCQFKRKGVSSHRLLT